MQSGVNVVLACCALLATQAATSSALAEETDGRWVPSFAITSGVTFQNIDGEQQSFEFNGESATPNEAIPLRPSRFGDDLSVSPFVDGAVELRRPALPVPSRPRIFAAAEVLPTFAPERLLASEGDPNLIRGPEVGAVFAVEEDATHYTTDPRFGRGARQLPFGENDANGQGMRLSSQVDGLVWGAKAGVAFGFE